MIAVELLVLFHIVHLKFIYNVNTTCQMLGDAKRHFKSACDARNHSQDRSRGDHHSYRRRNFPLSTHGSSNSVLKLTLGETFIK